LDFLLDTCTVVWMDAGSSRLSRLASSIVTDPANKLFVSSVSVWEIAVKTAHGKLPLWGSVEDVLSSVGQEFDLETVPFEATDALIRCSLKVLHKDPFDLMLVCQAQNRDLTLVTPDPAIRQYPIPVLW
jgi:PIN domain nuclease of toxin-antitoxin system